MDSIIIIFKEQHFKSSLSLREKCFRNLRVHVHTRSIFLVYPCTLTFSFVQKKIIYTSVCNINLSPSLYLFTDQVDVITNDVTMYRLTSLKLLRSYISHSTVDYGVRKLLRVENRDHEHRGKVPHGGRIRR